MAQFQKGNELWKLATNPGRPKAYANAEDLWEKCLGYFQWAQDNPLYGVEWVKFQGEGQALPSPKMRALTIEGLTIYLGISMETWSRYRQRAEFSGVTEQAERIIRENKLTGAMADLLNPNIVARLLGLHDTVDHKIEVSDVIAKDDDLELARRLAYVKHLHDGAVERSEETKH